MDDLEFVQRCVKGDKQSWDKFLSQYSRLIYTYIHRVSNAKSCSLTQENINDIFQEIFHALIKDNFKKLKTFQARNGCSLATWLRQVTINFTIDYTRKIRPFVSLEEENADGLTLKDVLSDDAPFILETLSHKENLAGLKDCIKQLDTDDKFFLELYIKRGIKLEALRKILKVSRGAVDMRKVRIIDRLRDCFKKKGFALDF